MKVKLLILSLFLLCCATTKNKWAIKENSFRIPITVNTGDVERIDKPVDIELDIAGLAASASGEFQFQIQSLRLVEVDEKGKQIQIIAPIQFKVNLDSSQSVNLVFIMPGVTAAHTTRHFFLYVGELKTAPRAVGIPKLVSVTAGVEYEGQESFQINTPSSTYYYHKLGAGFAGLEDKDGNDWLGYNPGVGEKSQSGSGGVYRGLPNMGYPEGYCHPGKEVSTSWVVNDGPVKVSIMSESNDKKMKTLWDIFPTYARITIIQLRTPYWFLYEGTPGGSLQVESDFCVRAGNIKTPCSEKWEGDINADGETGEWLYFGDVETNRSIYLVQNQDDDKTDSYWPMNQEMTVFGFGRLDLEKYMERQNNQFTIGLADTHDYDDMKKIIDSACHPLIVNVGNLEGKP